MELFHENPIFEIVKSKVIISLFETVRLSVSISPRNLYNSVKSIKERITPCACLYLRKQKLCTSHFLSTCNNFNDLSFLENRNCVNHVYLQS